MVNYKSFFSFVAIGFASQQVLRIIGVETVLTDGHVKNLFRRMFHGGRDINIPRTICLSRDKDDLCTSWTVNSSNGPSIGEELEDITYYSVRCAQNGGRAEFRAALNDASVLYVCVPDKASG